VLPTPNFGPILGTPFVTDKTYLIHQISEGESLPLLINRYETSEVVIRSVNAARLVYGFLPDIFLIILPGQTDPSVAEELDLIFLDEEVLLSEFAAQFGLTEEELRSINGLGPGDIIPSGRWIIYPVRDVIPTLSATPIVEADLSQALTDPFGPNDEYILHQVKSGDTINTLGALYHTSVEVIQQANIIEGSIRIDQILVILPNHSDPEGVIKFRVIQVETLITVEDLADQIGISVFDLIHYNSLTINQLISPGQWIIYPTTE
jgi:LysM repeat protein